VSNVIKLNWFYIIRNLPTKMMPVPKAIHQTMFKQEGPTPNSLLWTLTQQWSHFLEVLIILVHLIYISFRLMTEYRIISLRSFISFPRGKKFTLVEYQSNCMEIDLSDRTNNVWVIKYFNLQLFVLSTTKVWEFYNKSEFHTYCD